MAAEETSRSSSYAPQGRNSSARQFSTSICSLGPTVARRLSSGKLLASSAPHIRHVHTWSAFTPFRSTQGRPENFSPHLTLLRVNAVSSSWHQRTSTLLLPTTSIHIEGPPLTVPAGNRRNDDVHTSTLSHPPTSPQSDVTLLTAQFEAKVDEFRCKIATRLSALEHQVESLKIDPQGLQSQAPEQTTPPLATTTTQDALDTGAQSSLLDQVPEFASGPCRTLLPPSMALCDMQSSRFLRRYGAEAETTPWMLSAICEAEEELCTALREAAKWKAYAHELEAFFRHPLA